MDRHLTTRQRWSARLTRWVKAALAVAALGFVTIWSAGGLRPGVRIDGLRVATVERGDLVASFSALGIVEPAAERVMTSPVDGRLLKILRRPGSVVERGDVLLTLDTSATRLELSQVAGRLGQARSQRRQKRLEIEQEAADFESRLAVARLELEEASFEVEQSKTLHGEGLISVSALRTAETRKRRLAIQIRGLETSREMASAAAAAELDGLGATIESLESERDEIERILESATGRAERAGVVTWILEDEGRSVLRGEELARLADVRSFRLEATVSDVHAQSLRVGLATRAVLGDTELLGRVSRVLPAVDDGVLRFVVELDEPDYSGLRPSLRLDVQVITATHRDVLRLERGSLAAAGRSRDLFVVDASGDRAERRRVGFGAVGGRHFEITSGLDEGERVILNDLSRWRAADSLRLR
ncbi:MAG: efflux RND transporter periplasmic adaptor subunit [Acidobacteriota bacterium]